MPHWAEFHTNYNLLVSESGGHPREVSVRASKALSVRRFGGEAPSRLNREGGRDLQKGAESAACRRLVNEARRARIETELNAHVACLLTRIADCGEHVGTGPAHVGRRFLLHQLVDSDRRVAAEFDTRLL